MKIDMPKKAGIVLATKGKFCKEDIEVVPSFDVSNTLNEYLKGTKTEITAEDMAGVTSIPRSYFTYHPITSIDIPDSVVSIGPNAFNATNLEELKIPKIKSGWIEPNICSWNDKLKTVIIAEGNTGMGKAICDGCPSLTTVILPSTMKNIGADAFINCTSLTSITFPKGIESVGSRAFGGCLNLMEIWVDEENEVYSSDENGILFNKDKTAIILHPFGRQGAYVIPDGVVNISGAFGDNVNLTSITIPDSVTTTGRYLLSGCKNLASVTIGNGITIMDEGMFYTCSALTSITIPENITKIGRLVFYNCSKLTEVICLAETPPTLDTTSFNGVPADCIIKVPAASLEAYKSATNWSERADYIIPIEE